MARHRALAVRPSGATVMAGMTCRCSLSSPGTEALAAAAERVEILTHARLADVHAVEPNLDRAVVGEQVCNLVPEPTIDVVTVRAL